MHLTFDRQGRLGKVVLKITLEKKEKKRKTVSCYFPASYIITEVQKNGSKDRCCYEDLSINWGDKVPWRHQV